MSEEGHATQTHIMYGASMNFSQVKKYITILIQSDLLGNEGAFYNMTKKGMRFLELYNEVTGAIGNIQKRNGESKVTKTSQDDMYT